MRLLPNNVPAVPRVYRSSHFTLLNLCWHHFSAVENSTCYSPGVIADGNYPCFMDQKQSACCGAGSICEASSLCRVEGSVGVSDLIRGGCTDSTWTPEKGPLYCTGQYLPSLSRNFSGSPQLTEIVDADTSGTNPISFQNMTHSTLDFATILMDAVIPAFVDSRYNSIRTSLL